MSQEYLDNLVDDVYEAVRTLERERYYEFTWALGELVRQAQHYQRIAESLLASQTSLTREANEREFNRANNERDWYRFPETAEARRRPRNEIEN